MAKMIECKSCGKEVAKSAKSCPHCGQKLKKGFMAKAAIVIAVLIVVGVVLSPSGEEKAKSLADALESISNATPSNLSPSGELDDIFILGSDYTDIQRDNKEKEINGQIVQWTLPVYEVRKAGDRYRVQTSGTSVVSTFIDLYPRSNEETQYIENLKTNDRVSFKGKIKGITLRHIEISPAILVSQ